ncbi:PRD domain-containing protein [Streptococcus sp. zg-86]|uniref:Ascorbate-specific PTS system EIIA component n=1 Tax=Streptococcus zhangguiae TaxID=2664091 RepID=A0A6I4RAB5_9STRE|nr:MULTISPECIES: PRD domain-containing protein [unclassified Streptococcus]MTB64751.1 PRD domain-containing protein [Streptococcus sp. zg-86]MTB91323.1 PRD domain-containing protein [Streptococcus sp. zg-36]MWV56746.1 PRD domain-containing protein [Streptococcus sp. zg-70]QTH48478.1 PRD domain-containing protein [Streptococcus sp. zg-86]
MYNVLESRLINSLLDQDSSATLLAKELNLSMKDFTTAVEQINLKYHLPLIYRQQDKVAINQEILEKHSRIIKILSQLDNRIFDRSIRKKIILLILLMKKEYLPVEVFIAANQVSKNTVIADIRELKEECSAKSINISYNRRTGYFISGDELHLRSLLVSSLMDVLELNNSVLILYRTGLFDFTSVQFLRTKLEILEGKMNISFADDLIRKLPYTLFSIIKRIKQFQVDLKEFHDLKGTKEFITVKDLFWEFDFLKERDLLYLTFLVMSSNVIVATQYDSELECLLNRCTDQFIQAIEKNLVIQFRDDTKIKEDLIAHLRPAIFRVKLGLHVINAIADVFIEEYWYFYEAVVNHIHFLSPIFDQLPLSKDEIVLIAMIVMGNVTPTSNAKTPFTGAVICKNGRAISHLLADVMSDWFPNIHMSHIMSKRQFEYVKPEVDFIFTTIPIQSAIPTFMIQPFLSEDEKKQLIQDVLDTIQKDPNLKAKEVIFSITSLIPEESKNDILEALEGFFGQLAVPKQEKNSILHSVSQISIREEMEWQQVIYSSYEEVYSRGSITENYIMKCQQSFYESYTTQIISNEVLLPHSLPENGVLEPDVQIILLRKPLIAPNQQSYRMIIALAPGYENEHVPWLVELNKKLRVDTKREQIFNARTSEELFEKIK